MVTLVKAVGCQEIDSISISGYESDLTLLMRLKLVLGINAAAGPSYVISPVGNTVNEGGIQTFSVATSNVVSGTTLYWTTNGGVTLEDFTDNQMDGTVVITGGIGTITRTIKADVLTEGTATFGLSLRTTSKVGLVVATSTLVTINDTSLSVSTNPPSGTLLSTACSGTTLINTYANGTGGTYSTTIYSVVSCGYNPDAAATAVARTGPALNKIAIVGRDDTDVAIGFGVERIKVYNQNHTLHFTTTVSGKGKAVDLAFSGNYLHVLFINGYLKRYSIGTGNELIDFPITSIPFSGNLNAMAIQPLDNKIIVVGVSENGRFCVKRFTETGSIDTTFGINGEFVTSFVKAHSEARAVAIQSDGKIVVAGSDGSTGNSDANPVVIRLNSNGTLDTSFASGGKFTLAGSIANRSCLSVVAGHYGKIYVGCEAISGKGGLFALKANGALDTGFGAATSGFIDAPVTETVISVVGVTDVSAFSLMSIDFISLHWLSPTSVAIKTYSATGLMVGAPKIISGVYSGNSQKNLKMLASDIGYVLGAKFLGNPGPIFTTYLSDGTVFRLL